MPDKIRNDALQVYTPRKGRYKTSRSTATKAELTATFNAGREYERSLQRILFDLYIRGVK